MTVAALKRVSVRDSLAKTVRLLTKQGIKVQFRGSQAYVASRGGKVLRMVLPEIDDSASERLLGALHGYLDHEVSHIYETPFAKTEKFAREHGAAASKMANIIEDIRIEKLCPRRFPGMKENLARLYDRVIEETMGPHAKEMTATGDATKAFAGVMIPGFRALAGQKPFQDMMDAGNYWQYLAPLLRKIPDLSRQLRAMETYDEVLDLSLKIVAALSPEQKQQAEDMNMPDMPEMNTDVGDPDEDQDEDKNAKQEGQGEPGDDEAEGDEAEGDEGDAEDDGDGEAGDDTSDEGDPDGGEGDGDGEGTQSEDAESDENCGGDDDEAGDEDGDGPSANKPGGDPSGSDGDHGDDESGSTDKSGKGKTNVSITDALKQLEPTQRRAIYHYKKERKSIDEIAEILQISPAETKELIRTGRRRINEIMTGGE